MTVCDTCGLSPELCVCGAISEQELTVGRVDRNGCSQVVVWAFDESTTVDAAESTADLAAEMSDALAADVERTADRMYVTGASIEAVRAVIDEVEGYRSAEGTGLPPDRRLADVETVERARREASEEADLARMTGYGTPEKLRALLAFEDSETNRQIAETIVHCGTGPIDVIVACLPALAGDSGRALTRRRHTLETLWKEVNAADSVEDPATIAGAVDPLLDDPDPVCRLYAVKSITALAETSGRPIGEQIDLETLTDRLDDDNSISEAAAEALDRIGTE